MHSKRFFSVLACAGIAAAPLAGATLNSATQAVLPQTTRQIISVDYHRLSSDPVASQVESSVLPPQMQGLDALLERGGLHPDSDVNRLTFATYSADKGVGLIGVAEGNFGGLNLGKFFTKTPKQPTPEQIAGVNVYSSNGLTFFMPDPSTLVFGARTAVTEAINTMQSGTNLGQNEQMANLVAGTQSTDAWSVLDAPGAQTMITSMMGAAGSGGMAGISADFIKTHFDGARYTITFGNPVQVNLEIMTTDALAATAVSTGLNAVVAVEQQREKDTAAKALLSQVQVDSSGDHAFLQLSAPENQVSGLLHSDLMKGIVH